MTRYLLLVSLGPVQDFIASARRCRDLWFGSWVLGELAKAAAAGIVEALGGDDAALEALVFPAAPDPAALAAGSTLSVANKLVVRVAGDAAHVRAVAEAGRARMLARLAAIRAEAFERLGERRFQADLARRQVDEAFEYVWVAALEAEAGYPGARAEAGRLLAARKNLRTWEQPGAWARAGVPKCSIDGVRESVLPEDLHGRPEERRRQYGVRRDERLCGVCLLKRWGVRHDAALKRGVERFFSTAHLAARPLMLGIAADAERRPLLAAAWSRLREAAGPAVEELDLPGAALELFGNADGAILFSQRLAETLTDGGQAERVEEAKRALRDFLREAGRPEPLPYYAVLVADGDGMGALIDARETDAAHRALSTALSRFAAGAPRLVAEHGGSLIYSGGDDVLAFLPLHRAVACAQALALRFHEVTGGATLSAGLAIVHYVDPMGGALELARRVEKVAKALPGKNALAVALDKRSGGTTIVRGRWDVLGPRLDKLAALHQAGAIPATAGRELAELLRLGPDLRAIQRAEAIRILGRKRARGGGEGVDAEDRAWLEQNLGDDPAALGQELEIARLIAQARAQAAPRPTEGA
jgi:CRISPR-associated protein Cmr2